MIKSMFADENKVVDPLRMMQRVIDKAMSRTQVTVQKLMYSDGITPEQMRDLNIIRMTELAMMLRTKNLSELYAKEDMISMLRMRSYSAPEYLKKLAGQVVRLFPDGIISIDVNCGDDCESVIFDSMRMSIILYNLLSNAIIHNRKKQKVITVSACLRGDVFVVRVNDNGRKIPEAGRKKLFSEEAITFDEAEYSYLGVKGLGLPLCRKAAKEMNGEVMYIPSAAGNTFEVTVPQGFYKYSVNETALADVDYGYTEMYMAEAVLSVI